MASVVHKVFRKLAAVTAPDASSRRAAGVAASPHLKWHSMDDVAQLIASYAGPGKTYLDVGGRAGEHRHLAEGFAYKLMDIDPKAADSDTVVGDICACPQIPDNSFDVVFSHNVFEHLLEPWRAAEEIVRICKPGGLTVHIAPFAWRYHPVPVDTFRYTHAGMTHLFERTGNATTLLAGYDLTHRREDRRGKHPDGLDFAPVDELGGWRENWQMIYAAQIS